MRQISPHFWAPWSSCLGIVVHFRFTYHHCSWLDIRHIFWMKQPSDLQVYGHFQQQPSHNCNHQPESVLGHTTSILAEVTCDHTSCHHHLIAQYGFPPPKVTSVKCRYTNIFDIGTVCSPWVSNLIITATQCKLYLCSHYHRISPARGNSPVFLSTTSSILAPTSGILEEVNSNIGLFVHCHQLCSLTPSHNDSP